MADEIQTSKDSNIKLANTAFKAGNYKQALAHLEKAREAGENPDSIRYLRGICYQQERKPEAAGQELFWLYKNSTNPDIKYKAWQALKTLPPGTLRQDSLEGPGNRDQTSRKRIENTASKPMKAARAGSGRDAWITPQAGYGRTGPEASSSSEMTIIPTSCSKRR